VNTGLLRLEAQTAVVTVCRASNAAGAAIWPRVEASGGGIEALEVVDDGELGLASGGGASAGLLGEQLALQHLDDPWLSAVVGELSVKSEDSGGCGRRTTSSGRAHRACNPRSEGG
jgi:hypothetical protein